MDNFDKKCESFTDELRLAFGHGNGVFLDAFVSLYEFILQYDRAFSNAWNLVEKSAVLHKSFTIARAAFAKSIEDYVSPPPIKRRFGLSGELPLQDGFFDQPGRFAKDFPVPCLAIYLMLNAMEQAIAPIMTPRGSRNRQLRASRRPLTARSMGRNHYFVTPKWRWHDCYLPPHSLNINDWLEKLDVFPTSLGGADVELWRLPDSAFDAAVESSGDEETDPPPISVGIWPVSRNLSMTIKVESRGVFRITPDEQQLSSWSETFSKAILPACAEHQVQILLIPELTSSEQFSVELCDLLEKRSREIGRRNRYPWLVICGSYHDTGRRFFNQCLVVSEKGDSSYLRYEKRSPRRGEKQWCVKKLNPFILDRRDITDDERRKKFGLDRYPVCQEPDTYGDRILIVETPIGRVWVTICVDYLKTAAQVANLRYKGLAEWILVASATPSTREFEAKAKELANSVGTVTVIGNACWLLEDLGAWNKGRAAAAYTPWRDLDWRRNGQMHTGSAVPEISNEEDPTCALDCSDCLWILTVRTHAEGDT